MSDSDPFSSKKDFPLGGYYHSLDSLDDVGLDTTSLPYSIRVLLEGALRNCDGFLITENDVRNIANWTANGESFSHSNMTTVQIEPYAYSSNLFDQNGTVIATVSGSYTSSDVNTMSTLESSKLCEDNPKLKLVEIMSYEDINSWEPEGEGDIIDGMLLMLFTFVTLFGLTKKKK